MATFLEKLAGSFRRRQETNEQSYARIVRDVADGKEPSLDVVAETLGALNRTPDDLQAAVKLLTDRRGWKKQVDAVPSLEREQANNASKIEAAKDQYDRDIQAANRRFSDTVAPLNIRQGEIERLISAAAMARAKLLESSDRPDVDAKAKELREEAKRIRESLKFLPKPVQLKQADFLPDERKAFSPSRGSQAWNEGLRKYEIAQGEIDLAHKEEVQRIYAEAKKLDDEAERVELGHLKCE